MSKPTVYTIGHSTHKADYFLELLQAHAVNCVVDVRSVAASRFNPQYNKKALATFLNENGITYLHFADEFGARQTNPDVLNRGKVDFEKVRNSTSFKRGVERIRSGVDKGYTIALMCAESEPLDCHRFSMVSVGLQHEGFEVQHILKDKSIISNIELEQELLKKYEDKLPKSDMFNPHISKSERLKEAYRLRNKDVGFSPYKQDNEDRYE